MAEYNLGTAKGKVVVDYDGKGIRQADADFKKVEGSADKTSKALKQTGHVTGVAGGAMAVGIGLATKVAIDFEKQISAIGAVSGASQQDLEAFRKKALQLGADTSFSATQAASAMEELAKAGLGTDDILNGAADAAVALAAAGGVELPEAAELAADAMTSFNLSARDLPKVADSIAGAANASSIGVSQFGQSLKQVGAVANLAGISFEETAQAIAILGANGIKGSDAGTSLKTMLSNLLPTTKAQRDAMRDLGLLTKKGGNAFVDATGKMKPLAEISQILQDHTKNLTSTQKQLALETIFGSDAIRAAAILTKSGAKGFDEMAKSMGKVTAEEVAAARLNNTAGALEQLKGSAETAAIGLAQALLPAILKITQAITKAVNAFNGLSAGTRSTIVTVALITSGILLLIFAITKIIAAAKAFMVIWRLLNLSFIASPIGLIILAIIALVAVIVLIAAKTDWFQRIWEFVWGGIKKVAGAVADWFTDTILPSFKKAWADLVKIIDVAWKVVKFLLDAWMASFKFWLNFILTIVKLLWNGIKANFDLIMSFVRFVINQVVTSFRFWQSVFSSVASAISGIINRVISFFSGLYNGVVSRITTLINFVRGIPGRIWSAIGNLGNLLYSAGQNVVQGLINGIWSMFGRLWSTLQSMAQTVRNFWPFSPAKVGPLSGRGDPMIAGKEIVNRLSTGITINAAVAEKSVANMVEGLASQLPVDNTGAVSLAATAPAPVALRPATVPAPAATTRTVAIQNLNITGVWDFNNPSVPRQIVARLHSQLDAYAKEHR